MIKDFSPAWKKIFLENTTFFLIGSSGVVPCGSGCVIYAFGPNLSPLSKSPPSLTPGVIPTTLAVSYLVR